MKLKLSLLFSIIYASLWAQPPHTFTANGSLVVPAGITSMAVQAWGGGGAGGGAAGAGLLLGRGAGGGGGGAYATANITVVAGNTLSVSVAGTTVGGLGDGAAGGNSTILGFESSILAAGGAGGGANTTGNTPAGGAGGSNAVSVGTTKNPGTNGGSGSSALLSLGLTSGAGGTGATPSGGAGGAAISSLILGTGSGNAGTPPGGGGSGAINSALGAAQIGGTGARGQVIVTYTCPTYQINATSAANVCISSGTSLVTVTSSITSLPIGAYTVTYNRSSPAGTALTAPMTVTTAGLGSFTANGFTTLGTSNITITSLTSGVCVSNITTNNTATVTVSPASIGGTVNGGTTICSGFPSAQLTLTGHTGTVAKWQSSVSPFSTWADIANTLTTYTSGPLTQTTQFRAVVQSGTCTSANSGFTTVTVNPLPTITLGSVVPVCATGLAQNTTLAYTATTETPTTYSISWNASPANTFVPVIDATLNASPISIAVPAGTAAGTYTGTLTVRNANNCTSSPGVAFSVVVNPLPTITLGTAAQVCATGLAQNTTLAYTSTTQTPTTYSIVWNASPANTFAAVTDATLNASPILIAVPAGTTAGTYTGTITVKNANSCTSSPGVAFSVVVNPLPTITLGTVAPVCATGLAQNTTLAYTATTNSPTTYSIVWNASPANTFTAVTNEALNASPISIAIPAGTAAGTYTGTLTVRNTNSCVSSSGVAFSVDVNPLPTITLDTVEPVCSSTSTQNTTLTYTATTNSPTTYSIVWNTSPTNTFAAVTNASLTTSPISIDVPAGTAPGTYSGTLTVANGNSCVFSSGVAFSVEVNPLPTITLGAVAPVCSSASSQNTTLAYTATTNSPTTYSIVWNASPTNNFAAVTNATLTTSPISIDVPAGTAPGTYSGTLTVTNANSCISSPGINFNVLINESPSAPIIGAITPASCTVATGSIALSGLPVGGTLTLYPGEIIEPYSGTTVTISGLSSNTYAFTVSNGICTSVSANAVVPSLVTNTYTTSWSNGTPTADQDIIFAGDFISAGSGAGDITACSCTVNAGVNITIQALDTLTLTNSLSNNGGRVTFENNASLLQINNAINTGNVTYKRTTTPILRGDFVYWSTPVNPQRLFDVSPLTLGDKYLAYNGDRWVITNRNTEMVTGKGYIIRAPQNYSNTNRVTFTASFIGQPNNGDLFGETVAAGKFYLIGNPYPSALDSDLFLSANLFLDGTLYFWTHNTPVPLVGLNRYNSDDYASYNFTGGVGIGTPAPTGTPQNNNSTPTGKIGAGQSFFATANNAGTVAFTNNMRLGGIDNSQFFKPENNSNSASLERHRLWLNMTNSEGAFKQMLIGYIEGATNDFESKYDGVTFDGNPYLDFYSIANDNRYVIQGRALPFTHTDVVPLGYRSTIAGDFTISIDHVDGDLRNHAIYIEDKVTNTIHNLNSSNYTFSTATGTYIDRFVLTYVNRTLGLGEFEANDKNVLVAVQNKVITITSGTEKVDTVYIYDLTGKMIYKTANLSDTVVKIDNLKVKNQVLLVKVVLDTTETKTYKIVY